MPTRVAPDDVKLLVETNRDVQPFIDDANLLVDDLLLTKGLSEARLTMIEKYLAAHLVTLAEERGGLTSTKVGEATDSYVEITGNGLMATRFGQSALTWDTSGTLSQINKQTGKLRAQFRVV